jgi:pyridinium-3,5-biscarboxylic acid mononucleotide sulfurtransferase
MTPKIQKKYEHLQGLIKDMGSVAIAFSGGVDSSLLLYVSHQVLKNKAVGITVKSPYIPDWELAEAKEFTHQHNIRHIIVNASIPESVQNNPPERCYLCKKTIFSKLLEITHEEGMKFLAEGTNFDDTKDYRPGLKALAELEVRSPLRESGLTKKEIRTISQELKLPTWDKPAYACLLTRLPYNTPVNEPVLKQIERAEKYLIDLGIRDVRVRHHGDIARIETGVGNFEKISITYASEINQFFKDLGYKFVTLDLGGYRMGSFNE